jgi:hypothetical protein
MKKNLRYWLIMVMAWEFASISFTAIGLSFINTFLGLLNLQPTNLNNAFYTYFHSNLPLLESSLFGFFFGSFFALIHLLQNL